MTVKDLKVALEIIPDSLPVYTHNGLDPSDYEEVMELRLAKAGEVYPYDLPALLILLTI